MLSRALTVALMGAGAVVAGCGGDSREPEAPREVAAQPSRAERAGKLPSKPQVVLRLDRERRGLPPEVRAAGARAGFSAAGYHLRLLGGNALRVPAPPPIRPSTRAVLIHATIRLPAAPGRAGIACRAGARGEGGYELTVDREGRFAVDRVSRGRRDALERGSVRIDPEPPRRDTLLTLLCGAGTGSEGVSIGYSIGAKEMSFVRDSRPLSPAGPARPALALVGRGRGGATFEGLSVSVAR